MLRLFSAVWRARRVLLIGSGNDASATLEAWLTVLGARCAHIAPDAGPEALYRMLTQGRVFAVIACSRPEGEAWLCEIRETGVPLTMLCPDQDAQEAALSALRFGVRFIEEGLPCGVYDLNEFS